MKPIVHRLSTITSALAILALSVLSAQALAEDQAEDQALQNNLDKINLPPGFEIDVYAHVPGARSMVLGQSTGTVFVGTRSGSVYGVVDKQKQGKADQVVEMMSGLNVPNGVAMHQGNLYVVEQDKIARYEAPGFSLKAPWKKNREVIFDKLPDKAHHGWRYARFGPDGKLYVAVGSPCNICKPQGIEGSIIRMDPDGSNMQVYASGIRNSVGLDFQPGTGTLYFDDNGVDLMGDKIPPGETNAAPEAGLHFGFPYYAGGDARQDNWKDKKPPQEVTMPVVEYKAHVAPLGLRFYTGDTFPEEYVGDAFVAQHGSWNRTEPIGYRLMRIRFNDDGKATGKEVFADGWLKQGAAWGRPVDVLQLYDGSLLVSDDYQGVIYRIHYSGGDN